MCINTGYIMSVPVLVLHVCITCIHRSKVPPVNTHLPGTCTVAVLKFFGEIHCLKILAQNNSPVDIVSANVI